MQSVLVVRRWAGIAVALALTFAVFATLTTTPAARAAVGRPSAVGRSAAEYVQTSRFHAVTVWETPGSDPAQTVTRTFTSATVIAELARVLNNAHAMPAGSTAFCPRPGPTYGVEFKVTSKARPALVAEDFGCGVAITVNGKLQPFLAATLAAPVTKLLKLR